MWGRTVGLLVSTAFLAVGVTVRAQEQNLLPKYGDAPKSAELKAADKVFIDGMDHDYHGDLKQASSDMALRGWQYLKGGDPDDAMRRFNQAWLLNNRNGTALWGMAAVESDRDKPDESLKLFREADPLVGDDLNFEIDYSRAIAVAANANKDGALLQDAYQRFQKIYKRAPQNARNLKNWAVALFNNEKYSEAWEKVKLVEATATKGALDPQFIAALEAKMPRPSN
jgi:tetratricopeptide (TPR) repeat protein